MDLADLLIDASVDTSRPRRSAMLGTASLDDYYDTVLQACLPGQDGQFIIRTTLNFAIQQLATRSRVDAAGEVYLQIGSLDASDLAAGLIQSMPHTIVQWVPGFTGITAGQTAESVDAVRARLPDDGMAHRCVITDESWSAVLGQARPGSLGLVCVFSDRITSELEPCVAQARARTRAAGRVVVFEVLTGARRPTLFDAPDFSGRYMLDGEGVVRILAITLLSGQARHD